MKQFKSLAPSTAVLLLSEDADARKIVCMAQVPQVVVIDHHTLSTPPHYDSVYHFYHKCDMMCNDHKNILSVYYL